MKKSILLAAGGLLLVSATAVPSGADGAKPSEGELSSVVAAPTPSNKAAAKPVAAPAAKPLKTAAAPREVAKGYPRCSATVRDRCIQGRAAATATAYRAVPQRRIQLASRAGERG
jgi:hypothetical protein